MRVGDVLLNPDERLDARIRDMHDFREKDCPLTLPEKCDILQRALTLTNSILLRHELMYALGQIATADSLPFLLKVLKDTTYDVVTRHEAGEAIGAISIPNEEVLRTLHALHDDESETQELRETCYLAWRRLEDIASGSMTPGISPDIEYQSVDPAPPYDKDCKLSNEELMNILATHEDMWERYRAMFSLRDRKDAVSLCKVLEKDTTSALLRHEIAFVLGQMQDILSVPYLVDVMNNVHKPMDHPMVRHEAAEALGAIASPECFEAIQKYAQESQEPSSLVRDSCIVAQDMYSYYKDWTFANQK